MLKSLSRVLGIAGSGISLFTFLYFIVGSISASDYSFDFYAFRLFIGVLISAAGIIGSLLVHKKPVTAAVIMIASGIVVFNFLISALFEAAPDWIASIAASLLTAAGVLALISARREPQSAKPNSSGDDCKEAFPVMNKLSRILGIIFAVINMLPWVFPAAGYIYSCFIVGYGESDDFSFALVAASGFLGSVLLRKYPMMGAALMLGSGGLTFYYAVMMLETGELTPFIGIGSLWIMITSLLLTAAGVMALISGSSSARPPQNEGPGLTAKDEEEAQPVLNKLSCISGVTGILLAVLPFIVLAVIDACFYFDDDELLLSIALLVVPVLVLAVIALAFTAITVLTFFTRKRPLIAVIIMIVFSTLNLSAPFPYGYFLAPPAFFDIVRIVSALLLIASAVFALTVGKASSDEGLRNKIHGIPVKD